MKRSEGVCIGAIILYYITSVLGGFLFFAGAPRVFLETIVYLSLLSIVLMCAFIGNLLLSDPSAREREAKRQIMLESPHVLMPDEDVHREITEDS